MPNPNFKPKPFSTELLCSVICFLYQKEHKVNKLNFNYKRLNQQLVYNLMTTATHNRTYGKNQLNKLTSKYSKRFEKEIKTSEDFQEKIERIQNGETISFVDVEEIVKECKDGCTKNKIKQKAANSLRCRNFKKLAKAKEAEKLKQQENDEEQGTEIVQTSIENETIPSTSHQKQQTVKEIVENVEIVETVQEEIPSTSQQKVREIHIFEQQETEIRIETPTPAENELDCFEQFFQSDAHMNNKMTKLMIGKMNNKLFRSNKMTKLITKMSNKMTKLIAKMSNKMTKLIAKMNNKMTKVIAKMMTTIMKPLFNINLNMRNLASKKNKTVKLQSINWLVYCHSQSNKQFLMLKLILI